MPSTKPPEWLDAERRDRNASRARLAGLYRAGPWVALPAITSLPMMAMAGEGDYIIAVLGALWAAMLAGAIHVRRKSALGSTRRSCATWVVFWSAILAEMMLAMTIAFMSEGSWR